MRKDLIKLEIDSKYNKSKVLFFLLLVWLKQCYRDEYYPVSSLAKLGIVGGNYLKARVPILERYGYISCKPKRWREKSLGSQTYLGYRITSKGVKYLQNCELHNKEAFGRLKHDVNRILAARLGEGSR